MKFSLSILLFELIIFLIQNYVYFVCTDEMKRRVFCKRNRLKLWLRTFHHHQHHWKRREIINVWKMLYELATPHVHMAQYGKVYKLVIIIYNATILFCKESWEKVIWTRLDVGVSRMFHILHFWLKGNIPYKLFILSL